MSSQSPAFVYTEVQLSVPFSHAPWKQLNPTLLRQPGFRNKTWLAGVGNHSVGGFYEFDSLEHARRFVVDYFPAEARSLGVAQTTRIFDGRPVAEASRQLRSPHFGARVAKRPGAFVYTEVQVGVPFEQAPWKELNPVLDAQPGLLHKTWLAGVGTNSLGGFYAFETIPYALEFAIVYFPTEIAKLSAAYTTRVFDAAVVAEASSPLRSPYLS
ncbi:MAG: hypothetical protein SFZ23_07930 [Planctomycetota bacterium]|nr:hypothetical protein [Planctomycetota bacterium]